MPDNPSHVQDRRETKAAKAAEKQEDATAVWASVEAERRAVEDKTARLRAMRLAKAAGAEG